MWMWITYWILSDSVPNNGKSIFRSLYLCKGNNDRKTFQVLWVSDFLFATKMLTLTLKQIHESIFTCNTKWFVIYSTPKCHIWRINTPSFKDYERLGYQQVLSNMLKYFNANLFKKVVKEDILCSFSGHNCILSLYCDMSPCFNVQKALYFSHTAYAEEPLFTLCLKPEPSLLWLVSWPALLWSINRLEMSRPLA